MPNKKKPRSQATSKELFDLAQRYLVGGVNSPVRSFRGVGRSYPLFISRGRGSKIYDEDGHEFIDYLCSWGASILGSANPRVVRRVTRALKRGLGFGAATKGEVEIAEIVQKRMPSLELMRFVSSGTEAAMSAVRVARAFTKREKIVKFDGCYHGHADEFLVRGGSGLATFSTPDSEGIPESLVKGTLCARYNDLRSVEEILVANPNDIAAIIVEPVAGNMGVIPPEPGFLQGLRKLADESRALLIFDEVITGFRVSPGGAQEIYHVSPDLTCLGKIIGGGANIAAYGGRQEIMKLVSPLGPVYQAGTLAGNPISVAAGIATLEQLNQASYSKLEKLSGKLETGLESVLKQCGVPHVLQRVGSMLGIFLLKEQVDSPIRNYDDVLHNVDRDAYSRFFSSMLDQGIYLPPSPFETVFLSTAHTTEDIDHTERAASKSFEPSNHKSKGK